MAKVVHVRVKNKRARYAALSPGANPKVVASGYKPNVVLSRAKKKLNPGEEATLVYVPKRGQAYIY